MERKLIISLFGLIKFSLVVVVVVPLGQLPVSAEKPNLLPRERYTAPALPSAYT